MKKSIMRVGIALVISSVLSIGIIMLQSTSRDIKTELVPILCDATFSVGVVFLCVGLLFLMSNLGIFDILAYGMASFFNLFRKRSDDRKFVDYLAYKEAKKENSLRWSHLVIIGILYMVVASVLLIYC